MKKLLFLLLALVAVGAKAQGLKGTIDLKDSVINRSIPFEVAAGAKNLKYAVRADLTNGEATLTFTDPKGKKAGGFTLSSKTKGGGSERSKVESSESTSTPVAGTWNLAIKTEKATGRITYDIEVIKP
ncbi:hypothetical protein HQ865_13575 [Mucilaginibacter mali]|uniref:YtkA-like domain-containing protein n=1 Tax=Mucilaginibacter mali TaxID=2740462 RepID=A0A7D4UBI2_9SPHI|nr:hypothetical protein [Mucilaginibacter mali]QKJ30738.1 hypothetical protein HQ865_13575 [Mucilaginibacter mali]